MNKITVYVLVFIFTLHLTPAIYVNSSFLEQFMAPSMVGYVYTIASAITIVCLFIIKQILEKIGNYRAFLSIILINILALLTLAFSPIPWLSVTAFVITFIMTAIAFFNIDIFLENISTDNNTGSTRGVFLTSLNSAFIVGPLLAGLLLTDHDFWRVYLLGAILLLPVLYILVKHMKNFKDPVYKKPEILKTAMHIWRDKNLHAIFSAGFLMRFFFAWMVIYTPIFLIDHIGFELSQVNLIIGIGLLPFILLEAYLGKVADSKYGEKEILTLGFIITALGTGMMTFVDNPNLILWMTILFLTRVGASMIEVMTETYLFKKIDSSNINILGFYRIVRPLAYVVGPLAASILLLHIDMKYLFIILAIIMLYGIRWSLSLRDTR